MDGREFIIVAPIVVEGELEKNPIIDKINNIIDFINVNRYRSSTEKDNDFKQKNPEANKHADIVVREKIARQLNNQANVMGVIHEVQSALERKYKSGAEVRQRLGRFTQYMDEFFKHIKFMHLTAVELAIVGMMVDTLVILIYQVKDDLVDDKACISVLNKQNELLRLRESIADCMAYHEAVFKRNNTDTSKEEFNGSDIVIDLFEAIEGETGIVLDDERKNLWPDTSYLQALPDIPFYKSDEPKMVATYFSEYRQSEPPGVGSIKKLNDDMRYELNLLSDEEEQDSVSPAQVDIEEPISAGCFSLSWWSKPSIPSLRVPDISKQNTQFSGDDSVDLDEESESSGAYQEKHTLDDVIRLLNSFMSQSEAEFRKLDLENRLRREMTATQQLLLNEIAELQKPSCFSCFSFFWSGTLHKKLVKQAALEYVLSAATLEELGQRAGEKLNGDEKSVVCAGWHSRTEANLKRVVDAVSYTCLINRPSFELL